MKIHVETERLILRDLSGSDVQGMFALDSDKDVHAFLGKSPIQHLEQAKEIIENIQKQYKENGIGRWAVIDKSNQEFLGWSGFKYITDPINNKNNYYDLGYRFIKKYWGKGYATETALASLEYAFTKLEEHHVFAMADINHDASNYILQKIGMKTIDSFMYAGISHNFYQITNIEWLNLKNKGFYKTMQP